MFSDGSALSRLAGIAAGSALVAGGVSVECIYMQFVFFKQPFENVGLLSMPLKINRAEWVSIYQVMISVKSELSLQFYWRDFGLEKLWLLQNCIEFSTLHAAPCNLSSIQKGFFSFLLDSRYNLLLDLISWKPTSSLYSGSNHSKCSKRAGLIHSYLLCALSLASNHPQVN